MARLATPTLTIIENLLPAVVALRAAHDATEDAFVALRQHHAWCDTCHAYPSCDTERDLVETAHEMGRREDYQREALVETIFSRTEHLRYPENTRNAIWRELGLV